MSADEARARPATRSWLHDGTPATKRKLAKLRAVKAKEDLVVEAALAWSEVCEEDGDVAIQADIDLVDACSALKRERGRK